MDHSYEMTKWSIGTLWKSGDLSAHGMKKIHYYMQDRFYIRDPQISRIGIPSAAFQYGSPEYHAPTLTPLQRAIVKRYLPGTTEYEELDDAQRARVDARNRTDHAINLLAEPMRPLLRNVPIPGLRGVLRRRIQPHYYHPFDPNRRDHVVKMTAPDIVREARWTVDKNIGDFQQLLDNIRTNPNDAFHDWYIGLPTAANPNPTVDNPNNANFVRQSLFNVKTHFTISSWQTRVNARKMDALLNVAIKCAKRYRRHIRIMGAKVPSTFWDAFNAYFGKMISASGQFNEPDIGRRSPGGSPLWG